MYFTPNTMLRHGALSTTLYTSRTLRALATRAGSTTATDEELSAARQWLAKFDAETIPRTICDVTFSRSSGPGGQNVNKFDTAYTIQTAYMLIFLRVNSKATLKISLSSLRPLIPSILWPIILESPYCKSDSVVIQSDDSRKQQDNVKTCHTKLHSLIVQAGKDSVPGETSQAQMARVKNL